MNRGEENHGVRRWSNSRNVVSEVMKGYKRRYEGIKKVGIIRIISTFVP